MTTEERQLLLKDLCARLPYGVKMGVPSAIAPIVLDEFVLNVAQRRNEEFKPYLRPMSSMTEEEREDLLITLLGKDDTKYFQILPDGSIENTDAEYQDLSHFNIHWMNFNGVNTSAYIDWLNAHHFDYRGLIEKGLALEAPTDMYKNKN